MIGLGEAQLGDRTVARSDPSPMISRSTWSSMKDFATSTSTANSATACRMSSCRQGRGAIRLRAARQHHQIIDQSSSRMTLPPMPNRSKSKPAMMIDQPWPTLADQAVADNATPVEKDLVDLDRVVDGADRTNLDTRSR